MNNSLLSIRTDDKTKKEITKFADSVGLSVSAFVTVVLKQAVKEGRVVLSPSLEPTNYIKKIINTAKSDYSQNKDIVKTKNKSELETYLDSI